MVYNSLTRAPRNIKEAIDWLIALRGADAANNLAAMGAAIHKFLADKPVGRMKLPALEKVKLITKEFLEQEELKGMWPANEMLGKFEAPLSKNPCIIAKIFKLMAYSDYNNVVQNKGLTATKIAEKLGKVVGGCEMFLDRIKTPKQYKSAYSSKATWESSCAKNPEACAVVLVGIAPMLYTGLRSLRKAAYDETRKLAPFSANKTLDNVLEPLGYVEPECRAGMTASRVSWALRGVNKEILTTLYDLAGFWAFY
ncbi:hypothetical protein, conserved [Babesia ovata]|uniref:Uncharacterized protein n=1 Tax=Babesia ovata TaxID=189622 RepID=A0A2H6KFV1_9APIC|nr:uncharacterized protein BOVATA_033650 [Babesia ovata]GBE61872.1 hypothetical protein, conserved [Babesia ovata]